MGDSVHVDIAMRYGNPSIGDALDRMKEKGCKRIAVLPMYPQFAGATTASVYDVRDYHDDPRYIKCLGDGLKAHLATLDWTPDVVMTSYHGLPQSYVEKGDPYQGECIHTTDLLRAHLGMSQAEMRTTFQSRFGPKAWLQPYTDKTLEAMPDEGTKKVGGVGLAHYST